MVARRVSSSKAPGPLSSGSSWTSLCRSVPLRWASLYAKLISAQHWTCHVIRLSGVSLICGANVRWGAAPSIAD